MVRRFFVCFVCLFSISFLVSAENQDSIQTKNKQNFSLISADTVKLLNDKLELEKKTEELINPTPKFKPNSQKSVLYGAIFPGLGQIYNRKYWKLPIVYGGVLGFSYAISWNSGVYNNYNDAYAALMSPNWKQDGYRQKWQRMFRGTVTVDFMEARLGIYRDEYKRKRDFFRRNRDLSIIGAIAFYALTVIDAYVDAELFDFDISPDLSLRVNPSFNRNSFSGNTLGIQCNFKF